MYFFIFTNRTVWGILRLSKVLFLCKAIVKETAYNTDQLEYTEYIT